MSLLPTDFISPSGEFTPSMFDTDVDLEDRFLGFITAVTAQLGSTITDEVVADEALRHGVNARAFRAAAIFANQQPQSGSLADQGSVSWGNQALLYQQMWLAEERLFNQFLRNTAPAYPSGAVPTEITGP